MHMPCILLQVQYVLLRTSTTRCLRHSVTQEIYTCKLESKLYLTVVENENIGKIGSPNLQALQR